MKRVGHHHSLVGIFLISNFSLQKIHQSERTNLLFGSKLDGTVTDKDAHCAELVGKHLQSKLSRMEQICIYVYPASALSMMIHFFPMPSIVYHRPRGFPHKGTQFKIACYFAEFILSVSSISKLRVSSGDGGQKWGACLLWGELLLNCKQCLPLVFSRHNITDWRGIYGQLWTIFSS